MPPYIALTACIGFILYIFKKNSVKTASVSSVLWIPTIWFFILFSKPFSMWINAPVSEDVVSIMEGSWIDRGYFLFLIVLSMIILFRKQIMIAEVVKNNIWVMMFYALCGISILWSDFPFVSFKRWVKALGDISVLMLLITDKDSLDGLKVIIRRCAFVLIPLSVCFIKYFPEIGRGYDNWTGAVQYLGATYSKNALGRLCMVCGLLFCWELLNERKQLMTNHKPYLFTVIILLAMIAWLLSIANSVTALTCFVASLMIILLSRISFFRAYSGYLGIALILTASTYILMDYFFDISRIYLDSMGRNVTLTDRTDIWAAVVKMVPNPWIGVGFESFWLGDRFLKLEEIFWFAPNQAHNGYIEVYLNLGIIGLFFVACLIISGYMRILKKIILDYNIGVLEISFFVMFLLYNVTEASFKWLNPLWNIFLIFIMKYQNSYYRGKAA